MPHVCTSVSHLIQLIWAHIHEAPEGTTEVNEKLWYRITSTTKPENIFLKYGRLPIQFCVRLRKLFPNNHWGNIRKFHFFSF